MNDTGWPHILNETLSRMLMLLAGVRELPEAAEGVIARDPGLTFIILERHSQLPGQGASELPTLASCLTELGAPLLKSLLMETLREQLRDPAAGQPDPQGLRQAHIAARMATGLAEALFYPRPHEAGLTGLLYNPTQLSEISSVERLADRVDAWGYDSFLGDALRYQHLPADTLDDAATLVRIAAAAHALLYGPEFRAVEDAGRLTGLPSALIERLRDETLLSEPQAAGDGYGTERLVRDLSLYAFVEGCSHVPAGTRTRLLDQLPDHLRLMFGLHHALLLEPDQDESRLGVTNLGKGSEPDLALRAQGGHLAAQALREGVPLFLEDAGRASSVLDKQLLHWARAEAMLAVPTPAGGPRRILLAFTDRERLRGLTGDTPYLARLLALAMPRQAAAEHDAAPGENWHALARRVVHEINNPLGIIKNYMAILRVKLGENPAIDEELRIIHEELDRVARITWQLVGASPSAVPPSQEIDLNALLEELIRVSEPGMMAHKQVHLDTRLDPDLPALSIERDRAKQLLLNLLLNAIEASPPAATVTLETHRVVGMRKDSHLEVLITNSGHPMRPDVLARLFDPQESDKGNGHAGLGLSIVKSLALELNADVNCRSYNGLTTFQVLLPLT